MASTPLAAPAVTECTYSQCQSLAALERRKPLAERVKQPARLLFATDREQFYLLPPSTGALVLLPTSRDVAVALKSVENTLSSALDQQLQQIQQQQVAQLIFSGSSNQFTLPEAGLYYVVLHGGTGDLYICKGTSGTTKLTANLTTYRSFMGPNIGHLTIAGAQMLHSQFYDPAPILGIYRIC